MFLQSQSPFYSEFGNKKVVENLPDLVFGLLWRSGVCAHFDEIIEAHVSKFLSIVFRDDVVDSVSLSVVIVLEKSCSDVHWIEETSSLEVEGIEDFLNLDHVSFGKTWLKELLWIEAVGVPCEQGRSDYRMLENWKF